MLTVSNLAFGIAYKNRWIFSYVFRSIQSEAFKDKFSELPDGMALAGARLVLTAAYQLRRIKGRYALCTMCVGVGQGTALILERV